jgi:NAD(P)-dependent dehydrogenase (short-subunit alcohol dehydrogenase family)
VNIDDRIAIVTGAASGIGRAGAIALGAAGARLVVVADRNDDGAEATSASICDTGGSAIASHCDVGQEADVVGLIRNIEQQHGPVDIYWANAGVAPPGGPEQPDDIWDLAWRVNVMAQTWAARALLPNWKERRHGHLVVTASMAALLTALPSGVYASTKHAALGLAEWVAINCADDGIRVSCLCPGAVRTPMLSQSTANDDAGEERIGGGGIVEPEEAARLVIRAILQDKFLVATHPHLLRYVERKATDLDRWIDGMARLSDRTKQHDL